MNTLLRFAVCVLLIAGSAHAQVPGTLGTYSNPDGTDCNLYDLTPQTVQYYVVHKLTPAAQASRFKAPIPDCMNGAVFLSDETMWPIKIGLVPDGTLVGYGGCVSSPILVLTINIFGMGQSSECCEYPVLPDPSGVTGEVEVEGCDGVWRPATARSGIVNQNASCWCIIPTDKSTWGKIKALYSE
ncbi:MAG: hypothetical protein JSW58_05895 [Candidatus Latescibacterota bacterium]|nr:MAG: hypothetical protein JSW58_05895 [Candidatus Latescibacterota bacterium]